MDWWAVVALVVAAVVILFPAAYIWGMNISGTCAAIKRFQGNRALARSAARSPRVIDPPNYAKRRSAPQRVAYGMLFFLLAILFPVLIWIGLFIAIRQPLLRTAKKVRYAFLFILAGISRPVLAWVGFVAAVRRPLLRAGRGAAYAASFFLFGIFMPLMIWVALAIAIREPLVRGMSRLTVPRREMARLKGAVGRAAFVPLLLVFAVLMPALIWLAGAVAVRELVFRWRESRLPSALVCRLDSDCPSGYICVGGRCVPQY